MLNKISQIHKDSWLMFSFICAFLKPESVIEIRR